jgi:hypothetical protein
MQFNKEQREGVARFLDTIAASALIAAVVGATRHSALSGAEITLLFTACPILLVMSLFWRKQP